jgi:hypothetical protein
MKKIPKFLILSTFLGLKDMPSKEAALQNRHHHPNKIMMHHIEWALRSATDPAKIG